MNRNRKLNNARLSRPNTTGNPADVLTVTPEFKIKTSGVASFAPKTKMHPGSTGANAVHKAH